MYSASIFFFRGSKRIHEIKRLVLCNEAGGQELNTTDWRWIELLSGAMGQVRRKRRLKSGREKRARIKRERMETKEKVKKK